MIACQDFTLLHVCPVQEMPSASCWTSAKSRWSSIWTDISCRQRNRSSPQPRKYRHSHPFLVSVVPLSLHLFSNEPLSFFYLCVWSGPVSLRQPALCHTSSVSLTLGPSLSVTHPRSSSAPSMTSLHCCPVKRSSYPGEKWSWIWDGRMAPVVLSMCCLPNESLVCTQHPTRMFGMTQTWLILLQCT